MHDMTMSGFTPSRCRSQRVDLCPPLERQTGWTLQDVGYIPLIGGNRLFCSLRTGAVVAVDRRSGEELWRHEHGVPFVPYGATGSILLYEDTVLVALEDAMLSLDQETGETRGVHAIPPPALSLGTRVDDRLIANFGDDEPFLAAYDLAAGAFLWQSEDTESLGSVAVMDNVAIHWIDDETLGGVDILTGDRVWSLSVAEIGRHKDPEGQWMPGRLTGMPQGVAGRVVVPIKADTLIAIDPATGDEAWRQTLDAPTPSSMTGYADGRVYIFSESLLHILDGATGESVRTVDATEAFSQADVYGDATLLGVTDQYVYAGIGRRSVIALHTQRGTIDWSTRTEAAIPTAEAPLAIGDTLYVVDVRGHLSVFRNPVADPS